MSTSAPTQSSKWRYWIIASIVAICVVGWYSGAAGRLFNAAGAPPNEDRARIFQQAISDGATNSATWPQTEADLLCEFWKSIAAKNYKQATIYCPGSVESDFAAYGRMPTTPEITIGAPEKHPRVAGKTLWPIKVRFDSFGDKTIKLAIDRLPDGRLAINGQHSIWW